MNLKEEIEKIVMLAKAKYLAGEFEFISANDHTAEIKIDNISIELWIANTPSTSFDFYKFGGLYPHESGIYAFESKSDKLKGYAMIEDTLQKSIKENLKLQIKQLQSRLS